MSQRFKAQFPVTTHMSPIDYMVREYPMMSKEEDALSCYNSSRAHDGLWPLEELPDGVTFTPIQE